MFMHQPASGDPSSLPRTARDDRSSDLADERSPHVRIRQSQGKRLGGADRAQRTAILAR
jgi:hypothetical protein